MDLNFEDTLSAGFDLTPPKALGMQNEHKYKHGSVASQLRARLGDINRNPDIILGQENNESSSISSSNTDVTSHDPSHPSHLKVDNIFAQLGRNLRPLSSEVFVDTSKLFRSDSVKSTLTTSSRHSKRRYPLMTRLALNVPMPIKPLKSTTPNTSARNSLHRKLSKMSSMSKHSKASIVSERGKRPTQRLSRRNDKANFAGVDSSPMDSSSFVIDFVDDDRAMMHSRTPLNTSHDQNQGDAQNSTTTLSLLEIASVLTPASPKTIYVEKQNDPLHIRRSMEEDYDPFPLDDFLTNNIHHVETSNVNAEQTKRGQNNKAQGTSPGKVVAARDVHLSSERHMTLSDRRNIMQHIPPPIRVPRPANKKVAMNDGPHLYVTEMSPTALSETADDEEVTNINQAERHIEQPPTITIAPKIKSPVPDNLSLSDMLKDTGIELFKNAIHAPDSSSNDSMLKSKLSANLPADLTQPTKPLVLKPHSSKKFPNSPQLMSSPQFSPLSLTNNPHTLGKIANLSNHPFYVATAEKASSLESQSHLKRRSLPVAQDSVRRDPLRGTTRNDPQLFTLKGILKHQENIDRKDTAVEHSFVNIPMDAFDRDYTMRTPQSDSRSLKLSRSKTNRGNQVVAVLAVLGACTTVGLFIGLLVVSRSMIRH